MGRCARGLSMMDVVFLTMIITTFIVPLFGLFPASRVTLRKAHQIQTAVFLAHREMNLMRVSFPKLLDSANNIIPQPLLPVGAPMPADDYYTTVPYSQTVTVTQDQIPYQINVQLFVAETRTSPTLKRADGSPALVPVMLDAVVTVTDPSGLHPVTLSSRLSQDMTQMSNL
ncbi:MAG: hypothetical protein ACYCW6_07050 [Candidatus Xenobia bacterium]